MEIFKSYAPLYPLQLPQIELQDTLPKMDLRFVKKRTRKPFEDSYRIEDAGNTKNYKNGHGNYYQNDDGTLFTSGTADRKAADMHPKRKPLRLSDLEVAEAQKKLLRELESQEVIKTLGETHKNTDAQPPLAKLIKTQPKKKEQKKKIKENKINLNNTLKIPEVEPILAQDKRINTEIGKSDSESLDLSQHSKTHNDSDSEEIRNEYYKSFELELEVSSVIFNNEPEKPPEKVQQQFPGYYKTVQKSEQGASNLLILGRKSALFERKKDSVVSVKEKTLQSRFSHVVFATENEPEPGWAPIQLTNKSFGISFSKPKGSFQRLTIEKNIYSKIRKISSTKSLLRPLLNNPSGANKF